MREQRLVLLIASQNFRVCPLASDPDGHRRSILPLQAVTSVFCTALKWSVRAARPLAPLGRALVGRALGHKMVRYAQARAQIPETRPERVRCGLQ